MTGQDSSKINTVCCRGQKQLIKYIIAPSLKQRSPRRSHLQPYTCAIYLNQLNCLRGFNVRSENGVLGSESMPAAKQPAACDEVLHDRHQPWTLRHHGWTDPTTPCINSIRPVSGSIKTVHDDTVRMNHLASDDNDQTPLDCSALVAVGLRAVHTATLSSRSRCA